MVLELLLKVTGALTKEDWDNLDCIMVACLNAVHRKAVVSQKNKFEWLCTNRKVIRNTMRLTAVVNLSSETLDEPICSVLNKTLNFAVAPTKVPFKEIICMVETALKDLPLSEAEEVRGAVY